MEEYLIKPWDSDDVQIGINLDMVVPPEIDELAQIVMTYYDMVVHDKRLITSKPDKGGAIWKIETDKGPRSLKVLHRKPMRSLFSIGAQDYIVNQGGRVPGLIKTKEGALYVEKGGKCWIVTDWVESLTPASKDLKGAQALCYGLGEFHKHSQGYIPPAPAQKSSRLYHWPVYYREIITKINWFRNTAKAYNDIPSSQSLLSIIEMFERQALDALALLEQSSYARMISLGEEHWGLVHQDYGWSNGQLGSGGLWVIDLDGVAYDLPIRDLRKLISSTMDDMGHWDATWIRDMIDAYHQANPLDRETYEVLLIDLAFPNEFYKHIHEIFFDPILFMNNDLERIVQHLILLEKTKDLALNELKLDKQKFQTANYDSRTVFEPEALEMMQLKVNMENTALSSLLIKENSPLNNPSQEGLQLEKNKKMKINKHITIEINHDLEKHLSIENFFAKNPNLNIENFLIKYNDLTANNSITKDVGLTKNRLQKDENQKLNVLMICTEKLPVPAVRGGAIQTYIDGISGMLSQQHDVTILGTSDPSLPQEEYQNNIQYVRINGEHIFEIYAKEVISYLKDHSFDLIHVFNRPRLIPFIREAAPHSRIILSMHNDMFNHDKIPQDDALTAINEVERIITVSDYVGNTICSLYSQAAAKVQTIYSGVNLNAFIPWERANTAAQIRQKRREEYHLESKTVILFVGRLTPKKGIDLLVQALNEVYPFNSDFALVVVGGTWYSEDKVTDYVAYIRSMAERSPFPVITTGYVSANLIHEWFWAGDIFVCPSQWQEPLARVHYEAMAAGLPFITTARGGNPEVVIEQNGLIVKRPEDANEFAEKIRILLSDPKRRQSMGQTGRRLAEERFGWERVAREVLDVWKLSFKDKTRIINAKAPKVSGKKENKNNKNIKIENKNIDKSLIKEISKEDNGQDHDLKAKAGSSVVKITRDMIRR